MTKPEFVPFSAKRYWDGKTIKCLVNKTLLDWAKQNPSNLSDYDIFAVLHFIGATKNEMIDGCYYILRDKY